MASLFKPPASTRGNPNSPRLKLPLLRNNQSDDSSNIYSTCNESSTTASGHTPEPLTSSTSTLFSQHRLYSSESSTASNNIKKRPAPPLLSSLSTATQARTKTRPELVPISDVANSRQDLGLKENVIVTHEQLDSKDLTPLSTKSPFSHTNTSSPYLRNDLNTSVESDFSNLISAYEQSSSPIKPLYQPVVPTQTYTDLNRVQDVDQLDENGWKYTNLKDRIETLGILGEGAGGSVSKCKLKNGSKVFALKVINTLNTDPEYQKQIFRELQFNRSFQSEYIVRYYGMFTDDENSSIYIAMEYMGGRSLDAIYKNLLNRGGRISEKVLGKIAEAVLRGLSYLHEKKVIHRDIKPQNILLNERGQVKLCDFGVSGEAVNSLATTFTGTSFYMAPERIQGQPYSVTSDVWSLGLTILEVANGKFPCSSEKMAANIAPFELLMWILTFTPELKDEPEFNIIWSPSFKSFIEYCLKKDSRERPSPRQMISHPWIKGQMKKKVSMEKFIKKCWEN
ncbi:mkk1p [Saccharomyces arboricola H-6]|uniref:mitogen-activated protein kinase kinase n=1 Tax=Saccharomyces arboricola (strain H-6 / AS 2.3317 / CBS 10644) TaxID=1160507 RepID=J8LHS8_SACAR|nr:mkk1p [Saccharomyces arboricola H-6]